MAQRLSSRLQKTPTGWRNVGSSTKTKPTNSTTTTTVPAEYSKAKPKTASQTRDMGLNIPPKEVSQTKQETDYSQLALNKISEFNKQMQDRYTQDIADTESMYQAKKESDLAALRNAIAKQKSSLNVQLGQAGQAFQPAREMADVERAKNLQSLREVQAAQGVFGGENISGQTAIDTQAAQTIGGLNQAQANYEADIMNTISDLNNAQSEQERQIISQNLADKIQATMGLRNQFAQTQASGMGQTLQALGMVQNQRQADRDFGMRQAQMTGYYNPYYDRPLTVEEQAMVEPYAETFAAQRDLETDPYRRELFDRASAFKMFSDPQLLQQYGDRFMTPEMRSQQIADESAQIQNQISQIELQYAPIFQQLGLEQAYNDISRGNLQNAQLQIQNSFLPEQQKVELERMAADIANTYNTIYNRDRATTYDVNRPYFKPGGTGSGDQNYRDNFRIAYDKFKSYPVEQAKQLMSEKAGEIIQTLGVDGYEELWNTVMADAIQMGQASPYGERPEEE